MGCMTKPEFHVLQRNFLRILTVLLALCNFDLADAEAITFPGGFTLGSSFGDAKLHADSRGWQITPLSPELPGSWVVGQDIGIYVCDDTLESLSKRLTGNLDDFAAQVAELTVYRGKPAFQVASFMIGSTRISSIDARFPNVDNINVAVQFESTGGKLAITTRYFSDKCADQVVGRPISTSRQ
ncbi:hypothetical protein DXM21_04200 [Agrobacterium rosae]|nr:hypothetical protein DXM21_04200 [Agrobacterium rosae]KAA3522716.1 hypothetical protein DXM25_04200 [Agrobacterium rosae]MQB47379.1 hypothetical protein [Agrobacterium rosae]